MKMVKSLILGSAAGLIAMSGAQAADLPVKAKAVEYVRICSLYGAGFYYIPGTDTCIKLGGYLRVDVLANTNSDASGNTTGAGGAGNRLTLTAARLDSATRFRKLPSDRIRNTVPTTGNAAAHPGNSIFVLVKNNESAIAAIPTAANRSW
jgi:Porin subfamily